MSILLPAARAAVSLLPSPVPRRQRRINGRHALVDGIPFQLPVNSADTPALMAAFRVDRAAATALLPAGEVHPLLLPGGDACLVITVVNYQRTDIGRYIEFSIALACTFGARPGPPLLPMLLRGRFGTGQYVLDLPVSSEISVKGGKGIWGMPKHQASLDFRADDRCVSSRYELDGTLGVEIEIDRPPQTALPIKVAGVNYCAFRGMLMKSSIYFHGAADAAVGSRARARLTLGDLPRVQPLRTLHIQPDPLFTVYLPSTAGILDDHFECWFLNDENPVTVQPEGLESVVGLGLSQKWLPAPQGALEHVPLQATP